MKMRTEEATHDAIEKLTETQRRVMSELVEIASKTEAALRNQSGTRAKTAEAKSGLQSR